jgi:hypothetical protein
VRIAAEKLRVDQVDGTDVERRWNADPAAEPKEMFHEVEADLTMIEAAVNMSRLSVDKAFGPHRFGEADEQPHGKAGSGVGRAAEEFAIEVGES